MSEQRSVNNGDEPRPEDRLARKRAERAAVVAKSAVVGNWLLFVGGCGVLPVLGLGNGDDSGLRALGYFLLGGIVALIGLCMLPITLGLRLRAKRLRQRMCLQADLLRSHDRPQDVNEAKWRDLLAASSRWSAVPAPQPTWPSPRRTTRDVNDQNEIPRGVRRALEPVARKGEIPRTLDRAMLPRGLRFALDEAERAAKVAKRALVVTLTLVGGGCSFAVVSVGNVGYADGNDMAGFEYVVVGALAAFVGLCVLPFAIGLQIKAYRMLQRLRKQIDQPSDDHLDGVNPPEWHNSLGTAPLWRKPGDSH